MKEIISKLAKKEKSKLTTGTATEAGKNAKLVVKKLDNTMAQLAPKTAAFDMPKVKGLASGLFNPVCVSRPANPSVHPIIRAMSASGNRMSKSIILSVVDKLEGEIRPLNMLMKDKFEGPVIISNVRKTRQSTTKPKRSAAF